MKAKREVLVREHEKQLAAQLNSDEAEGSVIILFNPLTPNVKEQILLSCSHTFLIKVLERSY